VTYVLWLALAALVVSHTHTHTHTDTQQCGPLLRCSETCHQNYGSNGDVPLSEFFFFQDMYYLRAKKMVCLYTTGSGSQGGSTNPTAPTGSSSRPATDSGISLSSCSNSMHQEPVGAPNLIL